MATTSEALAIALQHHQAGRLSQAEQLYLQIIQQQPDQVDALHLIGIIAFQIGKREEAIAYYQQALTLKPQFAEAHSSLGVALTAQSKFEEAIAHYQQAIAFKPNYADAHYNLGLAFDKQRQLDEAIAHYRLAIVFKPNYAQAHNNLGHALKQQGKFQEALLNYDQALILKPDYADAHCNRAHILLLYGDLQRGFAEYEWRWQLQGMQPRTFAQPLWDGSNLEGKTILLYAEQGLGDTIQFIRYVPLVQAHGGYIIVECLSPLIRLLAGVPGIKHLVPIGAPLPNFHFHAPLLSLPQIFETTLETVPAQIPYLDAPASTIKLNSSPETQLKVGIVWAGNPGHPRDCDRSCPVFYFRRLVDTPRTAFYSLQKGPQAAELTQLSNSKSNFQLHDLSSRLNDFADTAVVIAQLDLVITVDTAVAHLAGALGCPVWMLTSFVPDWRWLLVRPDSPWYPSMRIFRQDKPGDWSGVFPRVVDALRSLVDTKN